jgi:hypothetical protein
VSNQKDRKKYKKGKFKLGKMCVMDMECDFIEVEHYCEIKRNHFKIPEMELLRE